MNDHDLLAERFEASRAHLRGVAYRMLGSLTEAEDAVQEAWLRVSRTDMRGVENLGGWLTTVVSRVCLDLLRARKSRREEGFDARLPEPPARRDGASAGAGADPEQETLLADSVGVALLLVLNRLAPAERVAFVLHDLFALPFEEIAPIARRTPAATRQLASRARRRVQGTPALPPADLSRQRTVVDAFLAASRGGDMEALLAVLDPDVLFRADAGAVQAGSAAELRGAAEVSKVFYRRAQAAHPALVDGEVGVLVAPRGRLLVALHLTIAGGRIAAIDAFADPARLRELTLAVLPA